MFGDGYVVCVVRVHWSRDIDGLVVELACSDFKRMISIRSLVVKFVICSRLHIDSGHPSCLSATRSTQHHAERTFFLRAAN